MQAIRKGDHPPRMRGKVSFGSEIVELFRITPAHAGKGDVHMISGIDARIIPAHAGKSEGHCL